MNARHRHNDENELEAPQKLVAALKNMPRERLFVPPSIDRAVTNAARQHLRRPADSRSIFSRWLLWPALATACIAIAALMFVLTSRVSTRSTFAREDLNRDGRGAILGAFALARQIRDGRTAPGALDLNGDGVVNQRDTEIIAARAVALVASLGGEQAGAAGGVAGGLKEALRKQVREQVSHFLVAEGGPGNLLRLHAGAQEGLANGRFVAGEGQQRVQGLIHDEDPDDVTRNVPLLQIDARRLVGQRHLEEVLDDRSREMAAGRAAMRAEYAENSGQMQPIREQAGTFADSIKLWGAA